MTRDFEDFAHESPSSQLFSRTQWRKDFWMPPLEKNYSFLSPFENHSGPKFFKKYAIKSLWEPSLTVEKGFLDAPPRKKL